MPSFSSLPSLFFFLPSSSHPYLCNSPRPKTIVLVLHRHCTIRSKTAIVSVPSTIINCMTTIVRRHHNFNAFSSHHRHPSFTFSTTMTMIIITGTPTPTTHNPTPTMIDIYHHNRHRATSPHTFSPFYSYFSLASLCSKPSVFSSFFTPISTTSTAAPFWTALCSLFQGVFYVFTPLCGTVYVIVGNKPVFILTHIGESFAFVFFAYFPKRLPLIGVALLLI